jgi:hypothetical protein
MNPSRRVLITGSRNWNNDFLIHNTLTAFHWMLAGDNQITLVSGACPTGADAIGEKVARHLGWEVERHPADWAQYSKRAGAIRNREMVALGADICLAFILDGSWGSTHCAGLAQKAGIYTQKYERWTSGLSPYLPAEAGLPELSDPDVLRGAEIVSGSDRVPEGAGHYR